MEASEVVTSGVRAEVPGLLWEEGMLCNKTTLTHTKPHCTKPLKSSNVYYENQ